MQCRGAPRSETPNEVTILATEFVTQYIFTSTLNTLSGRQPLPVITVIWQKDTGEDGVGFITA